MKTNRTIFISDFFYNNHTDDDFFRDSFFYLKLHALFNCLTPLEIKTLYLEDAIYSEHFRGTLLNFISKKSQSRLIDFTMIANELIDNYSSQPYSFQIAYRTFLSKIIESLDKELIRNYFDLFIKSQRVNDRKKSYEVANYLWEDVEQIVWNNFFEFKDENALIKIIENADSYDLVRQLKKIWSKDYPVNRLKKLIIDKTCKEDITHFKFIKDSEPTFYIQAIIARNLTIDKKLLISLAEKMNEEKNEFIFYYLGLAKDWDLLTMNLETKKTER